MMTNSAYVEIEKLATARVSMGRNRTFEQAMDSVVQDNPELYRQYRDETESLMKRAPVAAPPVAPPVAQGAYADIRKLAQQLVATGVVPSIEQGIDRVIQEQPELYAKFEAERHGAPVAIAKMTEMPLYKRTTTMDPAAREFMLRACSRELVAKGLTEAQALQVIQERYPWLA